MYRESQFQSNAIGGWHNYPCTLETKEEREAFRVKQIEIYTAEIDAGLADGSTRDKFINDTRNVNGGYGLTQLYSMEYLETFYDFAQEWGTSIGDAEMQCAYTIWYLQNYKPVLWEKLEDAATPYIAGDLMGFYYDGTPEHESIGEFAESFHYNMIVLGKTSE